jgi:AraC-like DNA-binding protein
MRGEPQKREALNLLLSHYDLRQITAAVKLVARRTFTRLAPEPAQKPGSLAKDVVRYVLKNYARGVSLNELAREAGLSKFHMVRKFRRMTGITPSAFLKRVRLVRAMDLLLESNLRIKHVAREVGYTDTAAFCRAFRITTSISPGMYRLTRQSPWQANETISKNTGRNALTAKDGNQSAGNSGEQRVPPSEVIAGASLIDLDGAHPSG